MKFTVGYQPRPGRDFLDAILAHREALAEVYFPWGELPNGRRFLRKNSKHCTNWPAKARLN